MIPVDAARQRIIGALAPVASEMVPLADGLGRVLAAPLVARRSQPPVAVSAMDGYACRSADVASVPTELRVVGRVPAGTRYTGRVAAGETVRLFTGSPIPDDTDTVVIQENVAAAGNGQVGETVTVTVVTPAARHVRLRGNDFTQGSIGLAAGRRLTVRDLALAAGMNHPWLPVRRRPRVAILSTGDEIVAPGDPIGPDQIVNSNAVALCAFVRACGGIPVDLGIAPDRPEALAAMAHGAAGCDLLVTTGGASEGDHDLVRRVLGDGGLAIDFWKIAMRPGKPLMFGRSGSVPLLGLPGNPVSTLVCALLFLGPALDRLTGGSGAAPRSARAVLAADMAANDHREDYVRAELDVATDPPRVRPFARQDSSQVLMLASAGALVRRAPGAPAAASGDLVEIVRFDHVPGL